MPVEDPSIARVLQDDELRVRIAAMCGWQWRPLSPGQRRDPRYAFHADRKSDHVLMHIATPDGGDLWQQPLPDYPNSLDAMAEALAYIHSRDPVWPEKYTAALTAVLGADLGGTAKVTAWHLLTAPARKCAEALLVAMEGALR